MLKYTKCMKNVDSSARCCGWAHQWGMVKNVSRLKMYFTGGDLCTSNEESALLSVQYY